jgi:hypothetical protein|tara:strand:+ start:743 stop:934 length:192 start_codon:yes stop_codon:yes gene_type:complete
MKNKQVAQIVLVVLCITFSIGFVVGFTGNEDLNGLVMLFSFINIGCQFWAIGRLWSATDNPLK